MLLALARGPRAVLQRDGVAHEELVGRGGTLLAGAVPLRGMHSAFVVEQVN